MRELKEMIEEIKGYDEQTVRGLKKEVDKKLEYLELKKERLQSEMRKLQEEISEGNQYKILLELGYHFKGDEEIVAPKQQEDMTNEELGEYCNARIDAEYGEEFSGLELYVLKQIVGIRVPWLIGEPSFSDVEVSEITTSKISDAEVRTVIKKLEGMHLVRLDKMDVNGNMKEFIYTDCASLYEVLGLKL